MGARILVVEDDAFTCRDIVLHLENLGYSVCGTAESADEAVAMAQTAQPDLVLMDIILSGARDGIDAANEIRAQRDIPIVYLTAYSDRRLLERAKITEPYGYILKPYSGRELHIAISFALYKWRADRRLRAGEWAEAAFASLSSALLTTTLTGIIEHANPAAETLLGIRPPYALGQTVFTALPWLSQDDARVLTDLLRQAEHADLGTRRFAAVTAPDGETTLAITATVIDQPTRSVLLEWRTQAARHEPAADIVYRASHDPLTGLINPPEFEMRLQNALDAARREGHQHALCYFALDRIDVISEKCGHLAADELLQQLAGRIGALGRKNRVLARLGGAEFALLLEDCTLAEAHAAAHALRRAAQDFRFHWRGEEFDTGVSIGVVPIADGTLTGADLIDAADAACSLARQLSGNRVYVFAPGDPNLLHRADAALWAQRVRNAIDDQRLMLYSQHVVPLTGSAKKRRPMCEILVRMLGEQGELIEPAAFLSAAETHHLLPHIDRWVIQNALRAVAQTRRKHELFCLNLSGQSLSNPDTLDFVREQLAVHQIDPSQICFDITETAAVVHIDQAQRFIRSLREQGCGFALDDFGGGQSSYRYLKQLPVDFLKIDGCFVRGLATDHVDYAMIHAANELGKVMGVKTIAEHVDTQEALNRLCALGVGYAQGYRLHRPEPFLPAAPGRH